MQNLIFAGAAGPAERAASASSRNKPGRLSPRKPRPPTRNSSRRLNRPLRKSKHSCPRFIATSCWQALFRGSSVVVLFFVCAGPAGRLHFESEGGRGVGHFPTFDGDFSNQRQEILSLRRVI